MNRPEAITKIKDSCKNIAVELMRLNPSIGALDDKTTKDEIYAAVYRLTKELEIIKKKIIKLETSEDQALV